MSFLLCITFSAEFASKSGMIMHALGDYSKAIEFHERDIAILTEVREVHFVCARI